MLAATQDQHDEGVRFGGLSEAEGLCRACGGQRFCCACNANIFSETDESEEDSLANVG